MTLLLVAGIFLLAGAVQGFTGFGGGLVSMALLPLLWSLKEAVAVHIMTLTDDAEEATDGTTDGPSHRSVHSRVASNVCRYASRNKYMHSTHRLGENLSLRRKFHN